MNQIILRVEPASLDRTSLSFEDSSFSSQLNAAQSLRLYASAKSEQILASAQASAEALLEQAWSKGLQAGLELVHRQTLEASALKSKALREAADLIVELVFRLAEEVIVEELSCKPESILKRAAEAIAELPQDRPLKIESGSDLMKIARSLDTAGRRFEIVENLALPPSRLRISSDWQAIEIDSLAHFERLKAELKSQPGVIAAVQADILKRLEAPATGSA